MAKLNWFPWYPADFESNEDIKLMSYEERGVLVACLNHQWMNDSLPSDLGELAKLLRLNRNKLEKLWRGRVGAMFEYTPGTPHSTQGGRMLNTTLVLYKQLLKNKQKGVLELGKGTGTKLTYDRDTNRDIHNNKKNIPEAKTHFGDDDDDWIDHISDPHPGRRPESARRPPQAKPAAPPREEKPFDYYAERAERDKEYAEVIERKEREEREHAAWMVEYNEKRRTLSKEELHAWEMAKMEEKICPSAKTSLTRTRSSP